MTAVGWCIQIADLLEREPLVQEVIRLSKLEREASRCGGPIRDAVTWCARPASSRSGRP